MTPDITFIVPVYKAERYLPTALQSLRDQTHPNWEAVLIDDGSPDSCGALCDEAARQDSRFRVIHQPNQGVSAARNAGLDAARGRYVHFLDADDWLEVDMARDLTGQADECHADLVFFGSFHEQQDANDGAVSTSLVPPPVVGCYRQEPCKRLFPQFATHFFVTRQLYRRSLIEKNHCRFTRHQIGEDALFLVDFYRHSPDCLLGVDKPYYHYRCDLSNSASHTFQAERLEDNFYLSDAIAETVQEWDLQACPAHRAAVDNCRVLDLQLGIKNVCMSPLAFRRRVAWLRKALKHAGVKQAVRRQPLAGVCSRNDRIKLALLKLRCNRAVILLSSLNNRG